MILVKPLVVRASAVSPTGAVRSREWNSIRGSEGRLLGAEREMASIRVLVWEGGGG